MVSFMGLDLINPIIVAAGPWSRDHKVIQLSIDAGAAAVVTETITLEGSEMIYPRIYERDGELLNTTLYSTLPFEEWEEELNQINKKGSYIICNIRGSTPSELAYIATCVERWGADGLELCPFTPIGAKLEKLSTSPDEIYEMLRRVVDAVAIPVSVRLPHHLAGTAAFVKAVERAGVSAISTIETVKALWGVDIERRVSRVPTFGGYSGRHIFPITLASVATLSQLTNCQISAMGGVQTYQNVLECLMLGASTVQLGSVVMLHGHQVVRQITDQLEDWMKTLNISSYSDIQGAALSSLSTFEELASYPMKAHLFRDISELQLPAQLLAACRTACMKGAIAADMAISSTLCDGCGLCVSLLPELYEMK